MTDKPRLFTATEIAKFCAVDQKTIHNWVDKGSIESFRTPGRHLRFKAASVKAFLEKFGYDVPKEVADAIPAGASASRPADHEVSSACHTGDCKDCEGMALRGPCLCECHSEKVA